MKNKILILYILLSSITFLHWTNPTQQNAGTNLRGKIETISKNGKKIAAPNIRVDLYYYDNQQNKWILKETTFTDNMGFYYFRQIRPDTYSIQVNKKYSYKITVRRMDNRNKNYQDISVINM